MAGKSTSETPLARLRNALGHTQAEMAVIIGCTLADFKQFESGRRIAERCAWAAQSALGVSGQWLRDEYPTLPDGEIPNVEGKPWRPNAVHSTQAREIQDAKSREALPWAVTALGCIAGSAAQRGQSEAFTAAVLDVVCDIAKRFGVDGVSEKGQAMLAAQTLAGRKQLAQARLDDYCEKLKAAAAQCVGTKRVWVEARAGDGSERKFGLSRHQALDLATRGYTITDDGRLEIAASAGGVGFVLTPKAPSAAPAPPAKTSKAKRARSA